jgi:hypothetical protein
MLTECIVCTTDPSGYAAKDERYSGHESEQRGNLSIVDLGYSRVVVVAPEHLDEVVPSCVPPTLSFLIYLLATPSNTSPGATRP